MPESPPDLCSIPSPNLVLAPRQQRGRDRQEALLQAGLHLTRTRHWDEVKVGDIAKEIGCSTGTFDTRFHDKAAYFEVLIGLVAEVMQQRADSFFAAPERMHETPREFVAQWLDLVLRSFSLHRGLYAAAVIDLRRQPRAVRAQSPLIGFRNQSRTQFISAMARWGFWNSEAGRQQLEFAHQLVQGVLINAALTDPGPLHLDDAKLHEQLAAVMFAYLGLCNVAE